MKSTLILSYLILSISLSSVAFSEDEEMQNLINLQARKLKLILETATKFHRDSIDINKACDAAFVELLHNFDANSEYYPKSVIAKLNERNQGTTVGIGIDFIEMNDTITVVSVVRASPADSAGFKIGDQILFINDTPVSKKSRTEALQLLLGDTSSSVTIIYKSFTNNELKSIQIERKLYESSSISTNFIIDNDIAYIGINRFSDLTAKEFESIAQKFISENVKKVIIDLRGNTGGYLGRAVEIADHFLRDSLMICSTVSKHESFREEFRAKNGGIFENLPLLVIVDSLSASGSEILAAAIQDNDRGLIVGQQTYGKATAQKLFNILDSTAFRITVAEYITPLGRHLHRNKTLDSNSSKLDESANLYLSNENKQMLENIINKYGGKTQIPVYTTPKGRNLFSSWGIYPDVIVQYDTVSPLPTVLRRKGITLNWALEYVRKNNKSIQHLYKNNFSAYKNDFVVDDTMLNDFTKFAISRKIWNVEMYNKDKAVISLDIKSAIAYILWGNNESNQITLENDIFVKTALQNFKNAELLIDN